MSFFPSGEKYASPLSLSKVSCVTFFMWRSMKPLPLDFAASLPAHPENNMRATIMIRIAINRSSVMAEARFVPHDFAGISLTPVGEGVFDFAAVCHAKKIQQARSSLEFTLFRRITQM